MPRILTPTDTYFETHKRQLQCDSRIGSLHFNRIVCCSQWTRDAQDPINCVGSDSLRGLGVKWTDRPCCLPRLDYNLSYRPQTLSHRHRRYFSSTGLALFHPDCGPFPVFSSIVLVLFHTALMISAFWLWRQNLYHYVPCLGTLLPLQERTLYVVKIPRISEVSSKVPCSACGRADSHQ